MRSEVPQHPRRRDVLCSITAAGAAAFWADEILEALPANTNTNSKPSELKITDLRVAIVAKAPMNCVLIRIDTNQGIFGMGNSVPIPPRRKRCG